MGFRLPQKRRGLKLNISSPLQFHLDLEYPKNEGD